MIPLFSHSPSCRIGGTAMAGKFTRTVEFARELLKLYQAQGREEFL